MINRFLIGQYVTAHGDVISHVNITHVMIEDGGEYSCIIENRAGTIISLSLIEFTIKSFILHIIHIRKIGSFCTPQCIRSTIHKAYTQSVSFIILFNST